jgi:hypothetical protein
VCTAPQVEGLANRATPYDNNTTYVAYRAELITEMTMTMFSYVVEVHSPTELLEMLLADARHFADAKGLAFDEHVRLSYDIYLENKSEAQGKLLQSCDTSSTSVEPTETRAKFTGEGAHD